VAKDLPAKTESTLWCEMNKDQRKIYDEVKNYYRLAISEAISQDGVEKSSFKILEGLLKLRQICDSPRLLKKKEYNTASSAKIDELLRELEENIGNHKVLVFSQFTEMLALVQSELLKKGISFNYLDGSSTPSKRKQQVEEFQNNTESRVFLISLKAGGVGLNLTSADYVYLIDPWWNPAAEQQAIDRAHRIGQDKSVFAYRMICKDSIEEKILQLQSHKKEVAGDLIKEDISLFKKMTKEDILGLFS
jgi:non-specific serine/threonine protein kinase